MLGVLIMQPIFAIFAIWNKFNHASLCSYTKIGQYFAYFIIIYYYLYYLMNEEHSLSVKGCVLNSFLNSE